MMLALEMFRSLPRTVAGKAMGARMPGILSGYAAPLRLVTIDPPKVDRPGWARLRSRLSGICGSDLGALSGKTSALLLGGRVAAVRARPRGRRRAARATARTCRPAPGSSSTRCSPAPPAASSRARTASPGHTNRCSRITVGHLAPGLQTGFCKDTGGGWGQQLVAHRSQMHVVPEGWSDEQALLMEPLSCAVHTALRAGVTRERPGAGQRRRIGRPVRHAGAAPAHPGRRDHRGRQARPPARAGARVRRHRGGAARRGAAPRTPLDRRLPAQAGVLRAVPARRRRRRRRRGRQQAVAGDRAATPPAPAAGWCCPGCRRRPTCPPRGSASSRSSAPTRRPSRRSDGRGAFDIAAELVEHDAVVTPRPSPWPATRCTGGARPSTMPTRPAGSVRSRLRSTRGVHSESPP